MYDNETDEGLMQAYQLGDYVAFEKLYGRYSGKVFGYLIGKLRNEALARDILQNIFLKLHRHRAKFKSPFASWFFTLVRNEMIDEIRRQKRLQKTADIDAPDIKTVTDNTLSFEGLNKKTKRVLEMRYVEDASFEDIGAELGTSPVNARKLVNRAVNKLRKLYGRE